MTTAWLRAVSARRRVCLGVVAALLAPTLSACFPIIVGAVAYGSYAATDRRAIGAQTDDKVIAIRGDNELGSTFGRAAHIEVTSFNRKVLLTGQVLDEASKAQAEQIMRAIPEVTSVDNELMIGPPSSLAQRSTDAYITTQIKAELVNRNDLFANAYKVVTESGVVYLMGRVTPREGDTAAEIARSVHNVTGVVKVFDYISEDELKRMQSQPPAPPSAPSDGTAPVNP